MKAQHISDMVQARHTFKVTHEGKEYDVVIWLNEKGKFADDEISYQGEELDGEGTEGQIREDITDYLAERWDDLVKQTT